MSLFFCFVYVASLGILSNPIARFLPRNFCCEKFPFAEYSFENHGKFYDRFGIRKWKDKMPDMSKVLKFLPQKNLLRDVSKEHMELLIQESCVAELVHRALIILSFLYLLFRRSVQIVVFLVLYNILGNLPFIMIQRYNRCRFVVLMRKRRMVVESCPAVPSVSFRGSMTYFDSGAGKSEIDIRRRLPPFGCQ